MAYTNGEKFLHGKNAQSSIKAILNMCKNNGYIHDYVSQYRVGKDGFSNKNQFYAPFLVNFDSGEKWAIFSTTSMRTDRIKGQQWDAANIKDINPKVKKAYLVYSDELQQKDILDFKHQNEKYLNKNEYSAIDEIISQNDFYNLIESTSMAKLNNGQIKNLQGKKFENRVAAILSDKDNLKKYESNDKTLIGVNYPIFNKIISSLNIKEKINEIKATADTSLIGKLPNGGNPKTDVYTIITTDTGKKIITISCKRSSSKNVSVHEYTANTFADTLDPTNNTLRDLLNEFQLNPSLSSFGLANREKLTNALQPYLDKLTKWVLAGIGGSGDQNKQWATHILTYDNNDNSIAFHTIDDYISALHANGVRGHFGTVFHWTYPSKKRGKSIQLKCKIIK